MKNTVVIALELRRLPPLPASEAFDELQKSILAEECQERAYSGTLA